MSKIKTVGILTSGGDSPGMNAAIRAVTRAGTSWRASGPCFSVRGVRGMKDAFPVVRFRS